eukprot:TRINITY_DN12806_c0_g3_i10.p1 TRINITY_DN12806_c0_g3~~TRINITY_DN12806_c0_g3_i10.p1  ORF type:complete len:236 (+),score=55.47 TRINITY_DN12806_c0_g3_i10:153-860(+)
MSSRNRSLMMITLPKKREESEPSSSHLSLKDLGPGIVGSSYLIRGCVLRRASELMALKEKGEKLPFNELYPLHYGNPQLLGQPPITFLRQVVAGAFYPALLSAKVFPEDVVKRVNEYLKAIPNGAIGAYADGAGFEVFRKSVSGYITRRDGHECDFNSVYLTDGAFDGMIFLNGLIFSKAGAGMMLSVPGFPGFSFLAAQVRGKVVEYELSEEKDWSIEVSSCFIIVQAIGGSLY